MANLNPLLHDLTLGDQINIATRALHTRLNRSITSRLPLALPPHIATPEAYTVGFAHFAHIYLAFESAWPTLSASTHKEDIEQWIDVKPYAETPTEAIETHQVLIQSISELRPEGLGRVERLHNDFTALCADSGYTTKENLNSILNESPVLQALTEHIRITTADQPHTLLAYAWTMYMAVFSGGRWIRGELVKAGPDFWCQSKYQVTTEQEKLTFWSFPGDQDGNDIKAEFKSRLNALEEQLNVPQREEIVVEAIYIFEMCLRLVEELDEKFAPTALNCSANTPASVPTDSVISTLPASPASSSGSSAYSSKKILGAAAIGLGVSAWIATVGSSYFAFLLQ